MPNDLTVTQTKPFAGGRASVLKAPGQSFASLDFLRGLSAFAVLISHTAASVSGTTSLLAFNWGALAVDVFMMMSGFLMMWHFYERRTLGESWGSSKTCLKFYTRRFFRIAPLYYFLLVLVYCFHNGLIQVAAQNHLDLHQTPEVGPHDPTRDAVSFGHVLSHFTFTFGFIPCFAASQFLPDWSIGLEMQFYLFFPFLALLLERSQFVGGVVLLVLINWVSLHVFGVGVFAEPKWLGLFPFPTFLPLRINCFLAGMLLAAGLFEKHNPIKRSFLLLLGLVVAGIYMKKFLLICFAFSFYELATTCGTGLPGLDQTVRRSGRWLGSRVFKFAAEASYGVYLIHAPVLFLVLRLLIRVCPFVGLSPVWRFLVCLAVMLPLVYALAFLAFKYIETPGINWGRKMVKRIR